MSTERHTTVLAERYRLLSLIGEGGMGAVYLGEHLHIGRRDAIKILHPNLAHDREAIDRFARGARNASAIQHPNVCTIYDFGPTDDGLHFLAQEYVEGSTLTEILQEEGRLPVERALRILDQTAQALEAAHELGIVHRDLKPSNIMIPQGPDGADHVKVVDFDIAVGPSESGVTRVTQYGAVVGTPEYMSPEQLVGDTVDLRSDLYSLGLIFFRMVTGEHAFASGSAPELMARRLTGSPAKIGDVAPELALPVELDECLARVLARDPDERPASPAEFVRDVTAALEGRAASAMEGADGPGSPRGGRRKAGAGRRRWPFVAGGSTVLVGVGAALIVSIGPVDIDGVLDPAPDSDGVDESVAQADVDGPEADAGEARGEPDERAETGVPSESPADEAGEQDTSPGERPAADGSGRSGAEEPEDPVDEAPEPEDPVDEGPERDELVEEGSEAAEPEDEGDVPSPEEILDLPSRTLVELPGDEPTRVLGRIVQALDRGGQTQDELRATRDTLEALWLEAPLTPPDSVAAAHNLSTVSSQLGDLEVADVWFEWAEAIAIP